MNVSLAPVSVGAPGSPLDVTSSLPGFLGGLDGTPSYYQITGLSTFTAYRVQLGNLTANVDLDVYTDVNFTASLCSAAQSSVAETCEATTPGTGELYVKVTNAAGSTDVAFIPEVMAPVVDEGPSGTPIDLTNLRPYSG